MRSSEGSATKRDRLIGRGACSMCGLQRMSKVWIREETWGGSLQGTCVRDNVGKRMTVWRLVKMKACEE